MNNQPRKIREFGLILALILVSIGYLHYRKDNFNISSYLAIASGFMLFISLVSYRLVLPIYLFLTTIAKIIGWINTRLLLSMIFYAIFTPIGLFLRIVGKDLLARKIYKVKFSYWKQVDEAQLNQAYYEKQF